MIRAPFSWTGILLVALGAAAIGTGCSTRDWSSKGPQTRSLKEYDRIDIRPLATEIPPGKEMREEVRQRIPAFASAFPAELRPRIYRRHILNASAGRLVVLEGSITRYDVTEIPSSTSVPFTTTVEMDIVLKDESGERIGGGKASGTGYGETLVRSMDAAERQTATAIAEHLRKSIRGSSEKAPADSPEER
jgi:hypothetical protein